MLLQQKPGGQKSELIQDFTAGPVFKLLARFAAPLFFANLLQIVYNLADMVIVGDAVGSTRLSAVSIGGDISLMLTMLIMGLVMHLEYMGFWFGDAIAGYTPLVIGLIFLASGKWKTKRYVIKE